MCIKQKSFIDLNNLVKGIIRTINSEKSTQVKSTIYKYGTEVSAK